MMGKQAKRVITTHEPLEPRPTLEETLEDMEVLGELLAEKHQKVTAAYQGLREAGMIMLQDREILQRFEKGRTPVG